MAEEKEEGHLASVSNAGSSEMLAKPRSSLKLKKDALVGATASCYEKWIIQGLLRRREIPPTKDGRHIVLDVSRAALLLDERTGKPYIGNSVRSSRYTLLTFLPGQLWFQFSKIANLYFLIVGILQLIPGLSTTGTYTTILPLIIFLSLTIAREGWDDYQRYRLDKVENGRLARVLYGYRPGGVQGRRKSDLEIWTQKCLTFMKKKLQWKKTEDSTHRLSAPSQTDDSSNTTISGKRDSSEPELWTNVKWLDIEVGDIIELKRNEMVPADIVLLYADGRDSIAYVETMALDGETNLKNREPSRLLHCQNAADIAKCNAHFVVEDPNLDLYDFNGRISVDGAILPLTPNNVVYRGSTLRNTTRAIGMVINTGEECKIRMNASRNPHTKAPAIQARTNRIVIILAVFVIMLATGCTAGYEIWTTVEEKHSFYLAGAHLPPQEIFIAFAIQFNNLIPLALYVSLELIKLAQFLMLHDIEMYDAESDTPMVSNTQNIYENLGQVNYIFSDKTGTLTENVMKFQKMSVSGTAWVHNTSHNETSEVNEKNAITTITEDGLPHQVNTPGDAVQIVSMDTPAHSRKQLTTDELLQSVERNPSSSFSRNVVFFFLSLALCHTGFPEEKDGKIVFQAASPDELALLDAARELGYVVVDRSSHSVTLSITQPGNKPPIRETYEVLDVIEFSSKRKRMSIIVRFPDGKICLFCKGADSVILPLSKLASLALQTASRIEQIHSQDIAVEIEDAIIRQSREQDIRTSFQRPSLSRMSSTFERPSRDQTPRTSFQRPSLGRMSSTFDRSSRDQTPRTSFQMPRIRRTMTEMSSEPAIGVPERQTSLHRPSLNLNIPNMVRRSMSRELEEMQQDSPRSLNRPSLNLLAPTMSRMSTSRELSRPRALRHQSSKSGMSPGAFDGNENALEDGQRTPRRSMGHYSRGLLSPSLAPEVTKAARNDYFSRPTEDEAAAFEHCLQHIHDFACEGLRTLIYGYRFLDENDYSSWKKCFDEATTSLTDRQSKIEAAAEKIERRFDIAGATGIEDKLQKGVPETIDKLQRANIKIWMLTGDKRETAINIAQSARICKSYSHIIVLDEKSGSVTSQITSALQEITDEDLPIPHSVVIIDGQTLANIENDEALMTTFYELLIRTDSVICCRASPSQKASLVKEIRSRVPGSITLAIGDGGNDIAMIQEAHVGVGISGKEGLQAARVADYSIAQFRFLQRLLLVHGHWNYVRTAKYIMLTFWKEMFFYCIQVLYQRWNGYTGTSLFENNSLTVWNTLFTALPVMIPGIFEQDLSAATLLAVPELYSFGQENRGFNMRTWTIWMVTAAAESVIVYFMMYGLYGVIPSIIDKGLFAFGNLGFSVCVVFINLKMLVIQFHHKTWIPIFCAALTIVGWWIWNFFLSAIYTPSPGPYSVRDGFTDYFGKDLFWWGALGAILAVLIVVECVFDAAQRWLWPSQIDVWQELEQDPAVMKRLLERGGEGGYGVDPIRNQNI